MLPEVALRLNQLAGRVDADIGVVEKTVASDPGVAALVLSKANSAFHNRGVHVQSLRIAITRLGLVDVRDIAFQIVASAKLFKVPEYSQRMRELNAASQVAGQLAREVCRLLHLESDLAFLCGLLHDLGEALILAILADLARTRGDLFPQETRDEIVSSYHSVLGAKACEVWKLPATLSDAILHHHHPERSSHPAQMAHVVAVADRLLEHVGLGVPKREATPMSEPVFYGLNLRPEDVSSLLALAERLSTEHL
jgi:HD-like signal output (HDOD) protein